MFGWKLGGEEFWPVFTWGPLGRAHKAIHESNQAFCFSLTGCNFPARGGFFLPNLKFAPQGPNVHSVTSWKILGVFSDTSAFPHFVRKSEAGKFSAGKAYQTINVIRICHQIGSENWWIDPCFCPNDLQIGWCWKNQSVCFFNSEIQASGILKGKIT